MPALGSMHAWSKEVCDLMSYCDHIPTCTQRPSAMGCRGMWLLCQCTWQPHHRDQCCSCMSAEHNTSTLLQSHATIQQGNAHFKHKHVALSCFHPRKSSSNNRNHRLSTRPLGSLHAPSVRSKGVCIHISYCAHVPTCTLRHSAMCCRACGCCAVAHGSLITGTSVVPVCVSRTQPSPWFRAMQYSNEWNATSSTSRLLCHAFTSGGALQTTAITGN